MVRSSRKPLCASRPPNSSPINGTRPRGLGYKRTPLGAAPKTKFRDRNRGPRPTLHSRRRRIRRLCETPKADDSIRRPKSLNFNQHSDRRGKWCNHLPQCAFKILMFTVPAIRIDSRSWLRSSSTDEPSDPPSKVIFYDYFRARAFHSPLFFRT